MKTSLLRTMSIPELRRVEKDLFAELRSSGDSSRAIEQDIAWVQKAIEEITEERKARQ